MPMHMDQDFIPVVHQYGDPASKKWWILNRTTWGWRKDSEDNVYSKRL